MTPDAVQRSASAAIDESLADALKDLPADWYDYIPYKIEEQIKSSDPTVRAAGEAEKAAYIAKERAEQVAAIQALRAIGSPADIRAHMEKLIIADLENTSPGIMVNSKAFNAMLDGEPLKNYLEGVRSSVTAARQNKTAEGYLLTRTFRVDAQQFGIPITAPGSERPVHGLTIPKNATAEELKELMTDARQYGGRTPVLITFRESVKVGSTVTAGDSLDAGRRPVPYDKPTVHAAAHGSHELDYRHLGSPRTILQDHIASGSLFRGRNRYDEVQYHRRPTAADIAHVTFAKEPSSSVKKKLAKLGATWSVQPLPEDD
jgi:hypothetical protein